MEPVAIELTALTTPHYGVELNWLERPFGNEDSNYYGYFLVVDEDGPDLVAPAVFWMEYRFEHSDKSMTELRPVKKS